MVKNEESKGKYFCCILVIIINKLKPNVGSYLITLYLLGNLNNFRTIDLNT